MALRTKTSLKSLYQTGDKPDQADFEDLIDTMVAIPTAATYPSFLELQAVASSTTRPVGAVGAQIVAATATSQVTNILDVPASIAHSTLGIALVSAPTTAAARSLLAITSGSDVSAGVVGAVIVEAGTTASARNPLGLGTMALRTNVSAGDMVTTGVSAGTYGIPTSLVVNAQGLITSVSAGGAGSSGFTLGTEQATTSGTSIDFTGIPAGTKIIKISYVGVSMNGTAEPLVQLGDAGDIEATGYSSQVCQLVGTTTLAVERETAGFGVFGTAGSDDVLHGTITLTLENAAAFTWTCSGTMGGSNADEIAFFSGSKSLSAELTRLRLTTVAGTATFDAGVVNISYIG